MNKKVKFKNTNQKAKTTIKDRYWILNKTWKDKQTGSKKRNLRCKIT